MSVKIAIYRCFPCFFTTLQSSHLRGSEIWEHFLGSRRESTHWHQPSSIKPGSTIKSLDGTNRQLHFYFLLRSLQVTQNLTPWMLFLKASECPEEKCLDAFLFLSFSNDQRIPEADVLKVLLGGLDTRFNLFHHVAIVPSTTPTLWATPNKKQQATI